MAQSKQAENRKAYQKEYRRIMNFIRRAVKRGYHFRLKDIPKKSSELKRVTSQSIKKLKSITPEKLYSKAKYESPTGEIISAEEGRKQERSQSAKKGVETRKYNAWLKRRRAQDKLDSEKVERDWKENGTKSKWYIGNIALDRIYEMISDMSNDYPLTTEYLQSVLDGEISTYGRDAVIAGLSTAPKDALAYAEYVIIYPINSPQNRSALTALLSIIRSELPTKEELQKLDELIEEDSFDDYEY